MLNIVEQDLLNSISNDKSFIGASIFAVKDINGEDAATLLKNMADRDLIKLTDNSTEGFTDEIIVGLTSEGENMLKNK